MAKISAEQTAAIAARPESRTGCGHESTPVAMRIRHALARICRKIARLGLGWADWWASVADRLEGPPPVPKQPVRGIGA